MKYALLKFIFLSLYLAQINVACRSKQKPAPVSPGIVVRKDTATLKKETPPARSPIIHIVDTVLPAATVIYIKDSAASSERIVQKLAAIYGSKLNKTIKENKLSILSPPMAWYKTNEAPFYFEAGFMVNKKPSKPGKKVWVKKVGHCKAVVAHFYGPYPSTYMAYEVLSEWLKERKKQRLGNPYEIYVTDPLDKDGKQKDPYKVMTDIVFPYK